VAPATPLAKNGVAGHLIFGGLGVVEPPPWPRGWSGHPQKKKKKNEKWVLAFWGWPDHPQGPGGGFGHPIFGQGGGWSHPRFLSSLFFFFFNIFLFLFSFLFFFIKKIMIKWPKRRRFEAQNSVVLELKTT
jgi:hypothetical protein